jgi:predicted polyphosphate/ATP-dependent NAD kinase
VAVAPVGIIANPASGKDIRRLVAHASVFDNGEKRNILRRVLLGAVAAGAERFLYMPDPNHLVDGAVDGLDLRAIVEQVEIAGTASALDTEQAAAAMKAAGCGVVVTLGGDGTNRAAVRGWREIPLVAISTGTNNVFPVMVEGTLAGAAAGLIACGVVGTAEASSVAKRIRVEIEGEREDLALIDAVLLDERWVGSRAVWHPERLREVLLARAEPAAVGLSALGGLLHPVGARDDFGLRVRVGNGACVVSAPIVPGDYMEVPIASHRPVALEEAVEWEGPGVLAFDGERERRLRPGQRARLSIHRDGPRVVDIERTMRLAACRRAFVQGSEASHGD